MAIVGEMLAPFEIAGTVYVETEWDPSDPIGETRWVQALRRETGLPTVAVACYAVGLMPLPLKGLERIWTRFDATLGAGLLTPLVLAGVWLGLRAWREQFTDGG